MTDREIRNEAVKRTLAPFAWIVGFSAVLIYTLVFAPWWLCCTIYVAIVGLFIFIAIISEIETNEVIIRRELEDESH